MSKDEEGILMDPQVHRLQSETENSLRDVRQTIREIADLACFAVAFQIAFMAYLVMTNIGHFETDTKSWISIFVFVICVYWLRDKVSR